MIQIIEDKTRVLIFFLGFFAITTHIYSYNFYNTERIFIKSIEASDNNINYSAALVEHYIFTKECQKAESAYKDYIQSLNIEIKSLMLKLKKCSE
jgi:hypothetical protein